VSYSTSRRKEDRLLEKVLDSGNIEVLEKYLALRKSERMDQSRIMFEEHFARMRAELPNISKTKDVSIRERKAYSYAPIERIQSICDPIIFRHGFTYSWREEAIPEGKRVWLDIFGYGHTRSNYFDSPRIDPITSRDGNAVTNVIQAAGVMSTYGKRYSFVSGFGLIIEDEDTDANIPEDIELLATELRDIMSTGKIIPETVSMITRYLMQDDFLWDVKKLQGWVKQARRKAAK
jgi:hypothetical protein